MVRSSVLKEIEQKQILFIEKQVREGSFFLLSKIFSKLVIFDNFKKSEVENGKEKKEESDMDEFFEEKKKLIKDRNVVEEDEDEDEKVDVVGGVKLILVL